MLHNDYVLNINSGSIERKIKRDYFEEYNKIKIINMPTFKEKVYLYLNPNTNYKCETCKKNTKLRRYSKGFERFCSPQCRGRIFYGKAPIAKISKEDVKYWPCKETLLEIAKVPNYSKSAIKDEFFDFYCFLEHTGLGETFNEKLHNYIFVREYCIECTGKTRFNPSSFSYNKFCSKRCANLYNKPHLTGGYNLKYFDRYPKEKNKVGYFYFISLRDNVEQFLKIGITTRSIQQRKNEICGAKYHMEIIELKELTLYQCAVIERFVLDSAIPKYIPKFEISGKTECFSYNQKDIICQKISDGLNTILPKFH